MTRDTGLVERPVGPDDDGSRVDVALAAWLGEPRARTVQRLERGEVTVDGEPAAKSRRLRRGEVVRVSSPAAAPAASPPPALEVRWEDDHLAVVAKPAGLVVHPGAGTGGQATLVDALVAAGMPLGDTGDASRPGIVHRLDRGTSGVLVVAKTAACAAALVRLFSEHDVDRRYWVLVDGVPDPRSATIDAPLGRSARDRTRFTVDPGGRRAVTAYDVEQAHPQAAVLTARLETGRTHQVRAHLAAIGHPVSGDRAYGASAALAARLGLVRPALHARFLGFVHPVTGEPVAVEEPLPADLRAAEQRL